MPGTQLATIIAGTLIALAAIGAATTAALNGTIDGASFSAIIGAAIGGTGISAATVLVRNGIDSKKDSHKELPPIPPSQQPGQ